MTTSVRRSTRRGFLLVIATAFAAACGTARNSTTARTVAALGPVRVDVAGSTLAEGDPVDGRALLSRHAALLRAGRTQAARRAVLRRPEAAIEAFESLPSSAELRALANEYECAFGYPGSGWEAWIDAGAGQSATAAAVIEAERRAGAELLLVHPAAASARFTRGAELSRGRAYEHAELAVLAAAVLEAYDAGAWRTALDAVLALVELGASAAFVLERTAGTLPPTLAGEASDERALRAARLAVRALGSPPRAADGSADLAWSLWCLAGAARLERGEARAAVLAFSRAAATARAPRAAALARVARGGALARAMEPAAARAALTAESTAEDPLVVSAALARLGALELAEHRAGIARALLERADLLAGEREADALRANLALAFLASGDSPRGLALLRDAQDAFERCGDHEALELALENELEHLRSAPDPDRERALAERAARVR